MPDILPSITGYRPTTVESGYVARQLLHGGYALIPRLTAPSQADADAIRWLTREALQDDALVRFLEVRTAEHEAEISEAGPRNSAGFESTLNELKRHSGDLGQLMDTETARAARALLDPIPGRAQVLLAAADAPPHLAGVFGYEDALALAAARWFKDEYFKWVDPIRCARCGDVTEYSAASEPTEVERAGGARRVELHMCPREGCDGARRFARFNTVKALMKSREGRCGEYAQLFYAFLLLLGLEARYVWNSEDHVWTEYWSQAAGHWVHVDSCEAEVGKPLLYDRGWGKEQRWCLAFGRRSGAEDVTRAYVDDWDACLGRRMGRTEEGHGVSERRLHVLLLTHTVQCRAHLDDKERMRLAAMDMKQAEWIADEQRRHEEAERGGLEGRKSGTLEWIEARGEGGADSNNNNIDTVTPMDVDTARHEPDSTDEVPGERREGLRDPGEEEAEAAAAAAGVTQQVIEVSDDEDEDGS